MTYPKMINWKYSPSKNGTTKELVEIVYVEDEATEKAIKKLGFIPYLLQEAAPGVFIEIIKGYTTRTKKHGELRTKYQKQYAEFENKYNFKHLKQGTSFKGFVYAPYLDLEYYFNFKKDETISEKLSKTEIENKFAFIKESLFYDEDFVKSLLDYYPLGFYHTAGKEWQNNNLPEFLEDLKIRNKEIYKELLKYNRVKELDLELACQEGRVRVKLLNKGYVKLNTQFFCGAKYTSYWDGEYIKVVFTDFKLYDHMLIKPTDDVYVTVVDENTLKFD